MSERIKVEIYVYLKKYLKISLMKVWVKYEIKENIKTTGDWEGKVTLSTSADMEWFVRKLDISKQSEVAYPIGVSSRCLPNRHNEVKNHQKRLPIVSMVRRPNIFKIGGYQ